MTNHIEQLMKEAGVKQYKRTYFECKGGRSTICLCPQIGAPNAWCKEDCNGEEMQEKVEYFSPVFTPEKQLKLIKLILKADNVDSFSQYYSEILKAFVFTCKSLPEMNTYNVWESINTDYALALSELAWNLIKESQLDKSEVKRILKDD